MAEWGAEFELPSPGVPTRNVIPIVFWKEYCHDGLQEQQGWVISNPYGLGLRQAVPATFFAEFRRYVQTD